MAAAALAPGPSREWSAGHAMPPGSSDAAALRMSSAAYAAASTPYFWNWTTEPTPSATPKAWVPWKKASSQRPQGFSMRWALDQSQRGLVVPSTSDSGGGSALPLNRRLRSSPNKPSNTCLLNGLFSTSSSRASRSSSLVHVLAVLAVLEGRTMLALCRARRASSVMFWSLLVATSLKPFNRAVRHCDESRGSAVPGQLQRPFSMWTTLRSAALVAGCKSETARRPSTRKPKTCAPCARPTAARSSTQRHCDWS
mmetsp:Transcript_82190/g.228021  ORF Transcript_82190/g.228021 Transcript_82190/m.228021 type:complete len:254 (-) Transcript_82190:611-1372(-)